MNFPFFDPPNTASITCRHILEEGAEILYVSHDAEDGMWQFLCGQTHEAEDARLLALEEVFLLDHTIAALADLPFGSVATRKNKRSPWKIQKR